MKRVLCGLALLFALAAFLPAQEPEGAKKEPAKAEEPDERLGLKWANFALLAIGLGYLLAKNLPPFFRARTDEIQHGIREAAQMKADADARAAAIECKLAGLGADIESLRSNLQLEMKAEGERIRQETERQAKRLRDQSRQEIAFMLKSGRQELRAFSAELALEMAKRQIAERMNPETQHGLVDAFVHDLHQDGNSGAVTQ